MSGMNWKLSDDHGTATMTFSTDPPVTLHLDAFAMDDLLKNLGQFRGLMKPEHAKQWLPGQRVGAIPDPAWYTEQEIMTGDTLLRLRDPRYGWLHYRIPRDEARKLAHYLQIHANTPSRDPQGDKAN